MTSKPAAALAVVIAALALSGCALPSGSVDDFLNSPGPHATQRTPTSPTRPLDSAALYRRYARSVVTVITDIDGDGKADQLGSGFVTARGGDIVTAVHVIGNLDSHRVAKQVFVQAYDGERLPATVRGTDAQADVALLRVGSLARLRIAPLRLGDSQAAQVGDPVMAIGAPLGQTQSLATGQVTGVDRKIEGLAGFDVTGALQTDAAINHGNSGGPLLDARGDVIGMIDQIATVSGGGEGIAFATPSNLIRRSLGYLARGDRVPYAYLGTRTQVLYPQLARFLGLPPRPGVAVMSVRGGSPAARGGVHGGSATRNFAGSSYRTGGDAIVAVDGRRLRPNESLTPILLGKRPGETVVLTIERDGRLMRLRVRLAQRPLLW